MSTLITKIELNANMDRDIIALTDVDYRAVCSHVCIEVWSYYQRNRQDAKSIDKVVEASEFTVQLLINIRENNVIGRCSENAQYEFDKAKKTILSNQLVSEEGSSNLYRSMWLVSHELDLIQRAYSRHYGTSSKDRGFIGIADVLRAKFDKLRVSDRYY